MRRRFRKEKGWAGIGYHYFIRKDGTLERGRDLEKIPAAQGGHNTGTIAICLHGREESAFTEAQFATLRTLCEQVDKAYRGSGAPITFHGHCEVSVRSCPVIDYKGVLGLSAAGRLTSPVGPKDEDIPTAPALEGLEFLATPIAMLKQGSKGTAVRGLQESLKSLGYFPGRIDGDFGPRTRDAVMAFQADNHLTTDGKFGSLSREAMLSALHRPISEARALASLGDLASAGSRIAQSSRRNLAIGAILGGGGLVTVIDEVSVQADIIQRLFADHGLITGAVILAAGAFVAWQSWRAGQARLEDHRTGKTA